MERAGRQAAEFELHRRRLALLARRMLGDAALAEEIVQEAWLRLSRSPPDDVRSLGGWLTTAVTRICLDELRARKRHLAGVDSLVGTSVRQDADAGSADPESRLLLADSIGVAMLIVLDRLSPAERVAFVLHDVFGWPFGEIAPVIERSPDAARQLASRARRRVRSSADDAAGDKVRQWQLMEAFLDAARGGNMGALIGLLAPDAVLRPDPTGAASGVGADVHGAEAIAAFVAGIGARNAHVALVDDEVGLLVAPGERLLLVIRPSFQGDRIAAFDTIASAEALARLQLSVLMTDRGTPIRG